MGIDVSVAIISKVPTRCKATGLPSTEYDECMFRVAPTFTGAAKMATCCTFDAATGLFKKKARRVLAASKRDLAAVSTTFKDAPKLVIAEPANATVLTNK